MAFDGFSMALRDAVTVLDSLPRVGTISEINAFRTVRLHGVIIEVLAIHPSLLPQ